VPCPQSPPIFPLSLTIRHILGKARSNSPIFPKISPQMRYEYHETREDNLFALSIISFIYAFNQSGIIRSHSPLPSPQSMRLKNPQTMYQSLDSRSSVSEQFFRRILKRRIIIMCKAIQGRSCRQT